MTRPSGDLVSRRAAAIRSSPALELAGVAARLRSEGHDVIGFGAGEPDLETPEAVRKAAVEAIRSNRGRYTPGAGLMELRAALASRLQGEGLPYTPEEVACTAGAKPGLFEALFVVLEPGQEVLFPIPYWNSYADIVTAAGGRPVPCATPAEGGFQPDPERLAAAITPASRVLLLNSPNNPTGSVYSRATLESLARLALERELVVISDDIYQHLLYTGEPFLNVLHVAPELRPSTLLVNSFSKSHSMTGWRLGWVAGPAEVVAAIARLQGQIAGSPSSIAQHAALGGLSEPPDPERVHIFDRRRKLMLQELAGIPGVRTPEPMGAFYAFPDLSAFLGRCHRGTPVGTTEHLVRLLLEEKLVAAIPGEVFGAPGHVRLTYACSEDTISEGMRRVRELLMSLEPPSGS